MMSWLVWAGLARAVCPADLPDATAVANGAAVSVDDDVAGHIARPGKLVATACLYSTGMMVKKVLDGGAHWTYDGSLAEVTIPGENTVSCPYTAGNFNILATELLETLVGCGYGAAELSLEGRSLEVDGVRYVVLTSFRISSTPHSEAAPRPAP